MDLGLPLRRRQCALDQLNAGRQQRQLLVELCVARAELCAQLLHRRDALLVLHVLLLPILLRLRVALLQLAGVAVLGKLQGHVAGDVARGDAAGQVRVNTQWIEARRLTTQLLAKPLQLTLHPVVSLTHALRIAARQPVAEPVCSGGFAVSNGSGEKYMAWGQVGSEWTADRSAALWLVRRADAEALAAENEDAWSILPVERCALPPSGWACTLAECHEGPCPTIAAPPAQAVDLPYSLDADPAGIRSRVADSITGTLWVGAQGHTLPPAGHWLEPFWRAAQADALVLQRTRGALLAAARSLRTIANSTKDTEFLESASEVRAYANSRANCAEHALLDSQAVGNG